MREYCAENKLAVNQCGKLVVTQNDEQLDTLKKLYRRGKNNNVEIDWITPYEAREIEKNVRTHKAALWSPTTASVNPKEVMGSLANDARNMGIDIQTNSAYVERIEDSNRIKTSRGIIEAGYIVNCAGLFSDRIALDFGFSESYRIIPFKGLYLYADSNSYKPKVNIYPVPDLKHPFLGVHFTITSNGEVKIGPTAIPALWREHYNGLEGFNLIDFGEILSREAKLFVKNSFGFRDLAIEEIKKYRKSYMITEAKKILKGSELMGFKKWGKPGIRAQLVNIKTNALEMDFRYEGDRNSFHVLNAVSPAFTCSLSFAKHLSDRIEKLIS